MTGYSRSTLSDAELGRHRLRREFWQRCDEALLSDGALTAAYDRIEAVAMALRRAARSQAQAAREEQASRRLEALLPASSAEGLGADGGGPFPPMSAGTVPAIAPGEVAPGGAVPGDVAPGGTAANGIVWGSTGPLAPAPVAVGPRAPRVAPDGYAPAGSARVAGSGRPGPVPPGPASSGAAAYYPGTATQSRREGAQPNSEVAQPNSEVAQPHGEGIQSHGAGAQPPGAVMEQCPHCHQPVAVIIVATTPPAAGSSAGW